MIWGEASATGIAPKHFWSFLRRVPERMSGTRLIRKCLHKAWRRASGNRSSSSWSDWSSLNGKGSRSLRCSEWQIGIISIPFIQPQPASKLIHGSVKDDGLQMMSNRLASFIAVSIFWSHLSPGVRSCTLLLANTEIWARNLPSMYSLSASAMHDSYVMWLTNTFIIIY